MVKPSTADAYPLIHNPPHHTRPTRPSSSQSPTCFPGLCTWTSRNTAGLDRVWNGVAFGAGVFVAVASDGTNNRVMSSTDGKAPMEAPICLSADRGFLGLRPAL